MQYKTQDIPYTLPETTCLHLKMDGWKKLSFPFWDGSNLAGANCCQFQGGLPVQLHKVFGRAKTRRLIPSSKLTYQ